MGQEVAEIFFGTKKLTPTEFKDDVVVVLKSLFVPNSIFSQSSIYRASRTFVKINCKLLAESFVSLQEEQESVFYIF